MKTLSIWFAMAGMVLAGTSGPFSVDGRSNIFGAGQQVPVEPGGIGSFGPGLAPPGFHVPATATWATFTDVSGLTNCIKASPVMGPDGGKCDPTFGGTDTLINSFGGISGIVARERQMFLVGLFLGEANPAGSPPARIDYATAADYDSASYSPELNQTFFIGDGLIGTGFGVAQKFFVPVGATRLFLGFTDAFYFGHYWPPGLDPGHYGDNTGALQGTLTFDGADGTLVPEAGSLTLAGLGVVCLWCRRR